MSTAESNISLLVEADVALDSGEYKKAIALYDKVVESYPEDYRGYWGRFKARTYNLDASKADRGLDKNDEDLRAALKNADEGAAYLVRSKAEMFFNELHEADKQFKAEVRKANQKKEFSNYMSRGLPKFSKSLPGKSDLLFALISFGWWIYIFASTSDGAGTLPVKIVLILLGITVVQALIFYFSRQVHYLFSYICNVIILVAIARTHMDIFEYRYLFGHSIFGNILSALLMGYLPALLSVLLVYGIEFLTKSTE